MNTKLAIRNYTFILLALAAMLTAALPAQAGEDDGISRMAFSSAPEHGMLPAGIEEGPFYFKRAVDYTFDEAAQRMRDALTAEGFGIQFELRPDESLRAKAGYEMPPYLIIGACNPKTAAKALDMEPWLGVLMPCNAVVRVDENGQTWVGTMHPLMLEAATGDPALEPIALELLHAMIKVLKQI